MACSHCGTQHNANFCPHCGARANPSNARPRAPLKKTNIFIIIGLVLLNILLLIAISKLNKRVSYLQTSTSSLPFSTAGTPAT